MEVKVSEEVGRGEGRGGKGRGGEVSVEVVERGGEGRGGISGGGERGGKGGISGSGGEGRGGEGRGGIIESGGEGRGGITNSSLATQEVHHVHTPHGCGVVKQ